MDELLELYETMGISPAVYAYGERTLEKLKDRFAAIDQVAEHNQAKVLWAMQKNRVSAACFAATTGYGYDDLGRETLDKIYAQIFGAEAALVRIGFVNGTHALTTAMFALANSFRICYGLLLIRQFFGGADSAQNMHGAAAAAVLCVLPLVVAYLCLQKYFIQGQVDSAVK